MARKYTQIGTTFREGGKIFMAHSVPSGTCNGCAFVEEKLCDEYRCASLEREDGRNVIFQRCEADEIQIRR